MTLTERIERLAEFRERIEELREECRESGGHVQSLAAGELDGVLWARDELKPLLTAMLKCVEALEKIADRNAHGVMVTIARDALADLERTVANLERGE